MGRVCVLHILSPYCDHMLSSSCSVSHILADSNL